MRAQLAQAGTPDPFGNLNPVLALVVALIMHMILAGAIIFTLTTLIRFVFRDVPQSDTQVESDPPVLSPKQDYPYPQPYVDYGASEYGRKRKTNELERMLRIGAFLTGVLVALGARASGVSIADLLAQSIGLIAPIRFALVGVALPAAAGVVAAWYFIRTMGRSNVRATRIMIFVGALTLTLFIDVYAEAIASTGLKASPTLVPNVAFVAAIGIYSFSRINTEAE